MRMGIAAAFALLLPTFFVAVQQQEEKGTIEGVVLSAATGAPVAGAEVSIGVWIQNASSSPDFTRPGQYGAPDAITGNDGRFSVKVRDGYYRVAALAKGFARQEYGQKTANANGARVDVSKGTTVKDIVIRLPQAGVLSGRVTDENRQPAVDVPVQVLRPISSEEGTTYGSVATTVANDRGEYRLFGLTPGRYYLVAGTSPEEAMRGVSGLTRANSSPVKYATTFYPGVSDLNKATPVEVKSASEATFDLSVRSVQYYRIRGHVIEASTGKPPANPNFSLALRLPGIDLSFNQTANYDPATGAFEVLRVVPGMYGLQVRTAPLLFPRPDPAETSSINAIRAREAAAAAIPMGQAVVNVVEADVENLQLVISTGVTLRARITREDQQIPEHFLFRIRLEPLVGSTQSFPAEPDIAEDGLFTLPNVRTGEYQVQVSGMVSGFYVKSLQYSGVDVLGQTMKFSETGSGILDIVIRRSTSEITGSVTDAALRAVPGVEVVLVPEQHNRTDLYHLVQTDASGHFTISRVAPGQYKVFSWEGFEPGAYFDPEFVRRYESRGRAVVVTESANATADVKLIPVEP